MWNSTVWKFFFQERLGKWAPWCIVLLEEMECVLVHAIHCLFATRHHLCGWSSGKWCVCRHMNTCVWMQLWSLVSVDVPDFSGSRDHLSHTNQHVEKELTIEIQCYFSSHYFLLLWCCGWSFRNSTQQDRKDQKKRANTFPVYFFISDKCSVLLIVLNKKKRAVVFPYLLCTDREWCYYSPKGWTSGLRSACFWLGYFKIYIFFLNRK